MDRIRARTYKEVREGLSREVVAFEQGSELMRKRWSRRNLGE